MENIKVIGSSAFSKCYALKNFKIPNNLTSIRSSAFERASLGKVIIPDSVTIIEHSAFERAVSNPIYCRASRQPSGWYSGWNYWGEFGSDDEDRYYDIVWGYTGN